MFIEIELAIVIVLQAASLLAARQRELPAVFHDALPLPLPERAPQIPATSVPSVPDHFEVIKRAGDQWLHLGFRPEQHPDVHEARSTPGLGIRHGSGRIEEGTSK